jgi:hypothetical protein
MFIRKCLVCGHSERRPTGNARGTCASCGAGRTSIRTEPEPEPAPAPATGPGSGGGF